MASGFFTGAIWGLVITGVAGATVSLIQNGTIGGQVPPLVTDTEITDTAVANPMLVETETPPDVSGTTPLTPQTGSVDTPEVIVVTPTPPVTPVVPVRPVPVEIDDTPEVHNVIPGVTPVPVTLDLWGVAGVMPRVSEDRIVMTLALVDEPAARIGQVDALIVSPPDAIPTVDAAAIWGAGTESVTTQTPAVEPTTTEGDTGPAPTVRDPGSTVKIHRFPGDEDDAKEAEDSKQAEAGEADADMGALKTHAVAFENPEAKPVMSVILIDIEGSSLTDKTLARLPFAVSFAIDATRADAGEVATRYRAAGFEVLILTNLPKGAKATDVEVAFQVYIKTLPKAVAVLDRGATSLVAGQMASIMAEGGYGLVTPKRGANSAQKAALSKGVPAATVYQELDAKEEQPDVIQRYLNRAAFRSFQNDRIIMLGHTRTETIEALMLWALEGRASDVAMAPVSSVLIGQ